MLKASLRVTLLHSFRIPFKSVGLSAQNTPFPGWKCGVFPEKQRIKNKRLPCISS